MSRSSLTELVQDLASDAIKNFDPTAVLEPSTSMLTLPTEFIWGASRPFNTAKISLYDKRGDAWCSNNVKCREHTGIHFDAPIYRATENDHATVGLLVESFVEPACVIDASKESADDPDFLISIEFIKIWGAQSGQLERGSSVLRPSDWSKQIKSDKCRHMCDDGSHTPGWKLDAVAFVAGERNVVGVGVETVIINAKQGVAQEPALPCHNSRLGASEYGLMGLEILDLRPAKEALKIRGGSGSQTRVLAPTVSQCWVALQKGITPTFAWHV